MAVTKQGTCHQNHAAYLQTQYQGQQAHDDELRTTTHLLGGRVCKTATGPYQGLLEPGTDRQIQINVNSVTGQTVSVVDDSLIR